jgi:hypothetical protein
MTGDTFRALALGLEGTAERAHMGHPDFRVNGRIFSSLTADSRRGTVKLTAAEQREFMKAAPGVFAPAAGAWGRQGWTTIRLEAADPATVRGALTVAWENIVQTGQRSSAKTAGRRKRTAARATRVRRTRA